MPSKESTDAIIARCPVCHNVTPVIGGILQVHRLPRSTRHCTNTSIDIASADLPDRFAAMMFLVVVAFTVGIALGITLGVFIAGGM